MSQYPDSSDHNGSHPFDPIPDVTDVVMSRLGFERLSQKAARRQRRRVRNRRIVGGLGVLSLVMLAVAWNRAGQDVAPQPLLPTSVQHSQSMRAEALSGLFAPLQELERALEIDFGTSDGAQDPERASGVVVSPVTGVQGDVVPFSVPFDEEDAAAPFPQS